MSFGYFNKIPLRKKDLERINNAQSSSIANIFGRLTGDSPAKAASSPNKRIVQEVEENIHSVNLNENDSQNDK